MELSRIESCSRLSPRIVGVLCVLKPKHFVSKGADNVLSECIFRSELFASGFCCGNHGPKLPICMTKNNRNFVGVPLLCCWPCNSLGDSVRIYALTRLKIIFLFNSEFSVLHR